MKNGGGLKLGGETRPGEGGCGGSTCRNGSANSDAWVGNSILCKCLICHLAARPNTASSVLPTHSKNIPTQMLCIVNAMPLGAALVEGV